MTETLHTKQLKREDDQVSLGIDRYYKHIGQQALSDTPVGRDLSFRAVESTAQAIEDMLVAVDEGKAGRGRPALSTVYLSQLEPIAAAYITVRCAINGMGREVTMSGVAMQIATQIEEHYQFDQLSQTEPGLAHHFTQKARKWTTGRARRFIMRIGVKIANVRGLEWKQGDKLQLGMKLLELFIETTGLATRVTEYEGKNNTPTRLRPTEATIKWMEDQDAMRKLMHPRYLPMLVPPKDWTGPLTGGYLTPQNRINFIGGVGSELRDDVFSLDLDKVYEGVNRVQSTPWRVNARVREVLNEVWTLGDTIGGLPAMNDLPLPARPSDFPEKTVKIADMDPAMGERVKAWRDMTRKAHEENTRMISRRISLATQVSMATDLKDDEQFYFPHNVDFRGRLYSVVAGLSPQGDDTGKALIEFAEGKKLGKSGAYWLFVHIANLFGVDKVSFDERALWVQEHSGELLDSAMNPLDGHRFWTTADYPYCALAACFEYAGWYANDEEHVSHLPIAMDGSCSGLQHFSAMLRDQTGGEAVNLVKLEAPADIYTQVAKLTDKLVRESGHELANAWAGNVVRKIVKRPCMTFAYSVTSRGMRDQILDDLRKLGDGDNYLPGVENYDAATMLAPLVEQAIKQTVERAAEAMDYLKGVITVFFNDMKAVLGTDVSEDSIPVTWYTPDGFPVQQRYAKMNGKRFDVWFQGERLKIQLRIPSKRPDTRKQASGIAPNFVHSMDACHLRMVVNRMVEEGVTESFAMIHDSFGVHACDVDELQYVIRDEFIKLYSDNQLAAFTVSQLNIISESAHKDLPDLPEYGDLDLEEVRDADFFFA